MLDDLMMLKRSRYVSMETAWRYLCVWHKISPADAQAYLDLWFARRIKVHRGVETIRKITTPTASGIYDLAEETQRKGLEDAYSVLEPLREPHPSDILEEGPSLAKKWKYNSDVES